MDMIIDFLKYFLYFYKIRIYLVAKTNYILYNYIIN